MTAVRSDVLEIQNNVNTIKRQTSVYTSPIVEFMEGMWA